MVWCPLKNLNVVLNRSTEMWMYVSWVTMSEPLVAVPLFAV